MYVNASFMYHEKFYQYYFDNEHISEYEWMQNTDEKYLQE